VIAPGPFTLSVFRLPLLALHLRSLRQLLLPRHHPPPPDTAILVIPDEMFWLRLVVVQMSLVLGRTNAEHLCHACQLGRHVRLPFSSSSHASHVFDLIHYGLWTSPVLTFLAISIIL
jgi:hypothetical protein